MRWRWSSWTAFLSRGAPWWFAFHAVADLPETLVAGHEAAYLDYFFSTGTHRGRGIDAEARDAFIEAYSGRDALRCAFAYYRAMPGNAQQVAAVAAAQRVTIPTLAIAGGVVGDALRRQLEPLCDHPESAVVAECGHIIPEEQPERLAELLVRFDETA
jgi:pimeloyl-ACP methyl ester carboxylesterase